MISVPSDVLLEIAKKLDPVSYSQFSMASSRVFCGLYYGRYTMTDRKCASLLHKKEDYRIEQEDLAAVQRDSWDIQFIKNLSEQVKLVAVQRNGWVIQFFENPSDQLP